MSPANSGTIQRIGDVPEEGLLATLYDAPAEPPVLTAMDAPEHGDQSYEVDVYPREGESLQEEEGPELVKRYWAVSATRVHPFPFAQRVRFRVAAPYEETVSTGESTVIAEKWPEASEETEPIASEAGVDATWPRQRVLFSRKMPVEPNQLRRWKPSVIADDSYQFEETDA